MNHTTNPKIVVIGGGTGSFTLLSGLKQRVNNLTALVNMADDGGSTGVLRDELGVLPPGDVRQCLVALSNAPQLRDVFNYRFSEGTLSGHSFGNLFLSTVEKLTDNFESAIKLASQLLNITGRVLPITTTKTELVLRQQDGEEVRGEFIIGDLHFLGKRQPILTLEPAASLTSEGKSSIAEADMVVIAPGNLYGTLAPALVVGGIKQALQRTSAVIVYVCNLVTKPNQTDGFYVHDYADEIERFIGAKVLDYVLYNTDEPPRTLLKRYLHDAEKIVEFDLEAFDSRHYQALGLPLIARDPVAAVRGDAIAQSRSLIRHDNEAITNQLLSILNDSN